MTFASDSNLLTTLSGGQGNTGQSLPPVRLPTQPINNRLDKAFDDVVEESNLKYQQMTIEHGEGKGQIHPAHWQDLVRADHPNIYVGKDDE